MASQDLIANLADRMAERNGWSRQPGHDYEIAVEEVTLLCADLEEMGVVLP
jgi:hypothetical protein